MGYCLRYCRFVRDSGVIDNSVPDCLRYPRSLLYFVVLKSRVTYKPIMVVLKIFAYWNVTGHEL